MFYRLITVTYLKGIRKETSYAVSYDKSRLLDYVFLVPLNIYDYSKTDDIDKQEENHFWLKTEQ